MCRARPPKSKTSMRHSINGYLVKCHSRQKYQRFDHVTIVGPRLAGYRALVLYSYWDHNDTDNTGDIQPTYALFIDGIGYQAWFREDDLELTWDVKGKKGKR